MNLLKSFHVKSPDASSSTPSDFVKLPIFSSDFAEPLLSRLFMQGNYFHAKYTTYYRHYFLKISRMSEVVELELFLKMGFFTSNDPPSDWPCFINTTTIFQFLCVNLSVKLQLQNNKQDYLSFYSSKNLLNQSKIGVLKCHVIQFEQIFI